MRFIVKTNQELTANQCLALDDALCQMRKAGEIEDTIFLWKPTKFMYTCINASVNFVDGPYAESLGYPLKRSATLYGQDASILLVGHCWNILSMIGASCKSREEIIEHCRKFNTDVWKFALAKAGLETEYANNDILVKGTERKLGAFGFSNTENVMYVNCFFSEEKPGGIDYNRMFPVPPEKFALKELETPMQRITSTKSEMDKVFSAEWMEATVTEYFASVGIKLEKENDFTQDEYDKAKTLEEKHANSEWVNYGRIDPQPDYS